MAILTEEQYQRAVGTVRDTEKFHEEQSKKFSEEGLPADQIQRWLDPSQCIIADTKWDVEEYQKAKQGHIPPFDNLLCLGRGLISARIASGLSQKELSEKLGIPEAQLIRDEDNEYHGISLDKAQTILSALGAKIKIEISFQ
jgi:hypothetical protein